MNCSNQSSSFRKTWWEPWKNIGRTTDKARTLTERLSSADADYPIIPPRPLPDFISPGFYCSTPPQLVYIWGHAMDHTMVDQSLLRFGHYCHCVWRDSERYDLPPEI
jgi:hypothetical protein